MMLLLRSHLELDKALGLNEFGLVLKSGSSAGLHSRVVSGREHAYGTLQQPRSSKLAQLCIHV